MNCDAGWLLAERVGAVVPGFAVGTGNAAAVATLEATIGWSYGLLSEQEQLLLLGLISY